MNLLEKAKIITTATAYDEGKLHSVKGGTDADFDVVRGSLATRVNAEGLIEEVATNIPRIDYSTGEGVILTEPQSTNTINRSNTTSAMGYHGGLVRSDDAATSPDGTFNAMSFIPTAAGGAHRTGYSSTAGLYSQNDIVTFSGFIKANGYNFVTMGGFFGQEKAVFNISDGTLVSQESNVINTEVVKLTSDWYRLSTTYTFQNSIGNGYLYAGIYVMETATSTSFTGDGVSGVYGYGFQAELGTGTSYIPTNGAIATRLADSITGAGSTDLINSEEGVLYVETSALADNDNGYIGLFGGSNSRVRIVFSNQIKAQLFNGSYQCNIGFTQSQTNNNKIAFKYKGDDFALWINGVEVGTDASGLTFSANTLSYLNLGGYNGANNFFGKTKCIAVFSEALTDEELTCLTTI